MTIKIAGFYTGTCQQDELFCKGTPSLSTPTGHYSFGFQDNPFDNNCNLSDTTKNVIYMQAGSNVSPPAVTVWRDTPQLVENQWYRIVAEFDSVNYKIYINGMLRRVVASPGAPIGTSLDSVVMGMDVAEAGIGYPYNFKGAIDDAKLFGRMLSDTEITHYGDTCGKINLQPTSVSLGIGHNANFTVASFLNPSPNYQWQQNSGSGFVNLTNTAPYSGVNTATMTITGITAAMSGYQYRCAVANSWGCTDTSQMASLTATNGVNNVLYNDPMVTVYPNPARKAVTITLPGKEGGDVQIINAVGQLIVEKAFTGASTQVELSSIPSGVYIIRIKYNDYIITRKLLKE